MTRRIIGLLRASHFGPNLLVTILSGFFAQLYWWEGPALVITFGVFCGQLVVGWSNDAIDYKDDLLHNRQKKPLVSGQISLRLLQNSLRVMLPLAIVINLFGPLGFVGGSLSVLAIGLAVAYNFYLTRILFRTQNHSWLIVGNLMIGAIFLLLCDSFIQLMEGRIALPINVLTSLIGAPFVVFLLMRKIR